MPPQNIKTSSYSHLEVIGNKRDNLDIEQVFTVKSAVNPDKTPITFSKMAKNRKTAKMLNKVADNP